jgi:hypothetical protein
VSKRHTSEGYQIHLAFSGTEGGVRLSSWGNPLIQAAGCLYLYFPQAGSLFRIQKQSCY